MYHAAQHGHRHMFIHTVNTDIVVLDVFDICQQLVGCELWLALGIVKRFQYLAAHQIAARQEMSCAHPMFHALPGCDIVSKKEDSMEVTTGTDICTTDAGKWNKGDPRRCNEHN